MVQNDVTYGGLMIYIQLMLCQFCEFVLYILNVSFMMNFSDLQSWAG
jgi:hypothetical protein